MALAANEIGTDRPIFASIESVMTIPVVAPKLRRKRDTGPVEVGSHITTNVEPGRATLSDSG